MEAMDPKFCDNCEMVMYSAGNICPLCQGKLRNEDDPETPQNCPDC
jgi:RNA polymerase subunit RPABC4/transcription elongation factor Spt4